jgi:1,4-dihydroxy-2-naphthoyl-CoA hydrolase
MSIWFKDLKLEELKQWKDPTMIEHLGIELVEITPNSLIARMPVDHRTKQVEGILHGGASAALAETVASFAAYMTIDGSHKTTVGVDLNISHLKSVSSGHITAEAKPVRLGSKIQVWEIRLTNDQKDLIAISRLIVMIIERR